MLIDVDSAKRARRRWADGKWKKLEEHLPAFLSALLWFAEHVKATCLEQEAWHRRYEEEQAQRAERQRLIEEEKRNLAGLLHEVDRWHRSQQIRAFVKAVVEVHEKANGPIASGSRIHQWIQWATHHADRFDPLVESQTSILDFH